MKIIGERISILKKEKLISVVILPTTDRTKLRLLFLWLFAWTVCGIIVLANYFTIHDQNTKLFIIIYLSFWLYFEFNIVRAFIWKKFGREKLWIQDGILHYQREINKKGKVQEFNLDLVHALQIIELKPSRFSDIVNQSFWIKGGERIEFNVQAKTIRLGMQLSDKEAIELMNEVNQFVNKELKHS
jgi:hypothetical protein